MSLFTGDFNLKCFNDNEPSDGSYDNEPSYESSESTEISWDDVYTSDVSLF
jgi:hypothetical protein